MTGVATHVALDVENAVREVEILVRWNHSERGLIPPASLVPLAEKNGDIMAVRLLVLKEACRRMQNWGRSMRGHPARP